MNPTLTDLLAWAADLPAAFRLPAAEDAARAAAIARLPAIIGDLHETIAGARPPSDWLAAVVQAPAGKASRDEHLAWLLASAHVCWHPALRRPSATAGAGLRAFFLQELPRLALAARFADYEEDEERREELIRRCLRALGARCAGEDAASAQERLARIDSIERAALLRIAAQRQEQQRKAEALRRKAEEEAAAKMGRE